MSFMWSLNTAFRAIQPFRLIPEFEAGEVRLARLNVPAQKIIREDQLHACFLEGDDSHIVKLFAHHHQSAISAMRRSQEDGTYMGAERPIEGDLEGQNIGFIPEKEAVVTLKDSWGCKALGMEGVQQAEYGEEAQRPVFKYAVLGDWMNTWENFNPLINLSTVIDRSLEDGQYEQVKGFFDRVSELENHAALFEHDFEFHQGSSWPRPPDHRQGDREEVINGEPCPVEA